MEVSIAQTRKLVEERHPEPGLEAATKAQDAAANCQIEQQKCPQEDEQRDHRTEAVSGRARTSPSRESREAG